MRRPLLPFRFLAGPVLFLAGWGACAGPQVPPVPLAPQVQDPAGSPLLDPALTRAAARKAPVVVVVHAEWCAPCNELELRVLEGPDPKAVLGDAELVKVDFEDSAGHALASRLRVLGLPTTLVLRPDGAGGWREHGRVEGFDNVDDFRQSLRAALDRPEPVQVTCPPDRLTDLRPEAPAASLLPALRCAAEGLRGPDAPGLAARLRAIADAPGWRDPAQRWSEAERQQLVDGLRLSGRYDARVAGDPTRCAQTFATLAAWPGTPARMRPGVVYWQAKCSLDAGKLAEGLGVLDAYLAAEQHSAAARELVADLLVHAKVEPQRARDLLVQVVTADPSNHWAHYLLAELALRAGDREAARRELSLANQLKPNTAIYLRHLARLQGDGHLPPEQPAQP